MILSLIIARHLGLADRGRGLLQLTNTAL